MTGKLTLTALFALSGLSICSAQDTLNCLPPTEVTDIKLNTQVAEDIRFNNDELFNSPMSRDKQYMGYHSISKEFTYVSSALGGSSARGREIYIAVRSSKKNGCAIYRYLVVEDMQSDGTYGYPRVANRITQISKGFADNVKKPGPEDWKSCDCIEKSTNWLKEKK